MTLGRREKLLLGCLAVLAGYQGVRLVSGAVGDGPLSLAVLRKSEVRQTAESLTTGAVSELEIAALAAAGGASEVGRDPFRFDAMLSGGQRRPVAPPRPAPRPDPGARVAAAAQAGAGDQAGPPAIDLSFLGTFGRSSRQIAVFSDGEAIINAFVGDTLRDTFVVKAIGFETVDVGFVGFPDHPPERMEVGD